MKKKHGGGSDDAKEMDQREIIPANRKTPTEAKKMFHMLIYIKSVHIKERETKLNQTRRKKYT